MPTHVFIESGAKKVFACALAWPGWARSGRTEGAALEALGAYARRYAPVAKHAGLEFPSGTGDSLRVVERVPGSASTDFGVPDAVATADRRRLTNEEASRLAALVEAAWACLDRVVADAPPVLRKGPRGGGRDRDQIVQHVVSAEAAYARKIGLRHKEPGVGDTAAARAMRDDMVAAHAAARTGEPLAERGWPARYAARRIAWHALDHAWEIEDKSAPAKN